MENIHRTWIKSQTPTTGPLKNAVKNAGQTSMIQRLPTKINIYAKNVVPQNERTYHTGSSTAHGHH